MTSPVAPAAHFLGQTKSRCREPQFPLLATYLLSLCSIDLSNTYLLPD